MAANRADLGARIATAGDGGTLASGYTCDLRSPARCDFALAKYRPDGSLDPAFGQGGKVRTDLDPEGNELGYGLDVRPSGEIVLSGQSQPLQTNQGRIAIAQYKPDGSLDRSFGANGSVLATPACRGLTHWGPRGWTSALQPDGKLVVAFPGYHCGSDGQPDNLDFVVGRYDGSGRLDTEFGAGGFQRIDFSNGSYNNDLPTALVVNPDDGAITVLGERDDGAPGNRANSDLDLAVARLTANGRLDPAFGAGGKLLFQYSNPAFDEGSDEFFTRARLDSQRRVVAAASCIEGSRCSNWQRLLVRLDANGVDSTFADGQEVRVGTGIQSVTGMAVLSSGKLLLAGGCDGTASECPSGEVGLQRVDANGRPDAGFGTNSWKTFGLFGGRSGGSVFDLAPVGNDAFATVGTCACDRSGLSDFVVGRFGADADPDPSFGTGGFVHTDFGETRDGDPVSYAALGDSVAAGEGIGYGFEWDRNHWTRSGGPAVWSETYVDERCHQSARAAPRGVAEELGLRLLHLACSGASASEGMLGDQPIEGGPAIPKQLGPRLEGAPPDVVSLSLGANDIKFKDEVETCYHKDPSVNCDTDQAKVSISGKLSEQRAGLRLVLDEIRAIGERGSGKRPLVFLTEYYDPFPDDWDPDCIDIHTSLAGTVGIGSISNGEFHYLKDGLDRLNVGLRQVAAHYDEVHVVPPPAAFRDHTYCSLNGPWVFGPSINVAEEFRTSPIPFHPTAAGQAAIKDGLVYAMRHPYHLRVGHDVAVETADGARVRFQDVATPGMLGVVPVDPQEMPPNSAFALQGQPLDIVTSSDHSGDITVSLPSPTPATLYHHTEGAWHAVPSTFADGYVSTTVESLSPFALGTPAPTVRAEFTSSGAGVAPAEISFDAAGSSVSSGSVAGYEWDFGDGSTATGVAPTHRYSASGSYDVTLRVTSSGGSADEAGATVTLTNPPPIASLSGPSAATAGEPARFGSGGSTDPNGELTWSDWDFGDGTPRVAGTDVEHSFERPGTYTVSLTVYDDELAPTTVTTSVAVSAPPGRVDPVPGPPGGEPEDPSPPSSDTGGGDGGDTTGNVVLAVIERLGAPRRIRLAAARRRGVLVTFQANLPSRVSAALRTAPGAGKGGRRLSRSSVAVDRAGPARLRLRLPRSARRLLRGRRSVPLQIRVTASSGATTTTLAKSLKLVR
jgi:uncharacterized delta-60 repeat protein